MTRMPSTIKSNCTDPYTNGGVTSVFNVMSELLLSYQCQKLSGSFWSFRSAWPTFACGDSIGERFYCTNATWLPGLTVSIGHVTSALPSGPELNSWDMTQTWPWHGISDVSYILLPQKLRQYNFFWWKIHL